MKLFSRRRPLSGERELRRRVQQRLADLNRQALQARREPAGVPVAAPPAKVVAWLLVFLLGLAAALWVMSLNAAPTISGNRGNSGAGGEGEWQIMTPVCQNITDNADPIAYKTIQALGLPR